MRKHRYIWSLAVAALIAAATLALVREFATTDQNSDNNISLDQEIEKVLAVLDEDQQLEKTSTQFKLRKIAVHIEEEENASAEAKYLLAKQYIQEHNLPKAEALLKESTQLEPEWALAWYELGTLLGKHSFGRSKEAEVALRKAIELKDEWYRPHNALAVLLRIQGRFEEAEKEALLSIEYAPDNVANHNNYANLLISMNRFEEAEKHYQIALDLDPDRPKPFYNLACLYALMGQSHTAMEYLEKAITLAPVLRQEAFIDPDLVSLQALPEFQELIYDDKTY